MSGLPTRPRIDPLPVRDGDEPQLNIFRTLARNKPLYKGFLALGSHLLTGDALPAREREIVILRVGYRAGSEYEFGQHTRIGHQAGLTDDEIARLATPAVAGWDPRDEALVRLADELCADDVVSDATWQALTATWSEQQMLDLLVLAGYYRLVSGMLNSIGVALEPTTAGWPATSVGCRPAPRDAS